MFVDIKLAVNPEPLTCVESQFAPDASNSATS